MALPSQAQKNIVRSFVGEGPVADLFAGSQLMGARAAENRCVSLCDPFALVYRPYGLTSANHGNAQVGNGPLGDLIRHSS